jgi:hypothetical protein
VGGTDRQLWLHDPDTCTYGGVYLFADRAAADASRATDLFRKMEANPAFAERWVQEYGVIEDPDRGHRWHRTHLAGSRMNAAPRHEPGACSVPSRMSAR